MRAHTHRAHSGRQGVGNEVLRYCPGCGRTVPFRDSGKVRRNANGKTIHAFAIFKCPKDHTWNRRLDGF